MKKFNKTLDTSPLRTCIITDFFTLDLFSFNFSSDYCQTMLNLLLVMQIIVLARILVFKFPDF